MTVSITGMSPLNITAWRATLTVDIPNAEGDRPSIENGYQVSFNGQTVYLTPKQADKLGRYLLFDDPAEVAPRNDIVGEIVSSEEATA